MELAVLEDDHVYLASGPNGPPAFYLLSPWHCCTTSDAGGDSCGLQDTD